MNELLDRVFGFMPQRQSFWAALSMFAISMAGVYIARWLEGVLTLPWMREENQKNRQKLLQEIKGNKE